MASACPHRTWASVGRKREGVQQQKCTRCGELRLKNVRPCLFWHSWANKGRPSFGTQRQVCRSCAAVRTRQVRPCWWLHTWNGRRAARGGTLSCTRCGTAKGT